MIPRPALPLFPDGTDLSDIELEVIADIANWFTVLCLSKGITPPGDPFRCVLACAIEAQATHRRYIAEAQLQGMIEAGIKPN